jgi:predicted RNA-binding protein YlxR (DUF448 family)
VCIGRDFNNTHTNVSDLGTFVSFPIYQSGIYALIFSPVAPDEITLTYTQFLLFNNKIMFGVIAASIGLFLLVAILSLACICREKKRQSNLIRMQKVNDQQDKGLNTIIDAGKDLDKDKFIEKLIQQLQSLEISRNQFKVEKKAMASKFEKQK